LEDAILENAKLVDAYLGSAILTNASLKGANLTKAILHFADLRGADLSETILEGTNLSYSKYNKKTKWPEGLQASLTGAKFTSR
jgi:uncharacterized protein YjbI with pentapeptide repeats